MGNWLDYSAKKISGADIRNAGYSGVIRYIDAPNLLRTKHTNLEEHRSHIAAGLDVLLVFEVSTTDPDGGFARGVEYAKRAKAGADYLGYKGVIFFCEDRPETPSVANWRAYLDGAASVLGRERVGAYGFKAAMDAAQGHAVAFWQAGRESDVRSHVNFYQWNNGRVYVAGVECDLNKVKRPLATVAALSPTPNHDLDEETTVLAPAATDDFITIPTAGKTGLALSLYVFTGYGRKVVIKEMVCHKRTPAKPTGADYAPSPWPNGGTVDADRPGPIQLPEGTVGVTLRYQADHPFTAFVG